MNFLRTLVNCCAGFQFYRNLLSLHPLKSIRFLAGVILLTAVLQIGAFVPVLWQRWELGAQWVQTNLPRFEIHGGQTHYDSPEPFVYTNESLRILLDSSGKTNLPFYTTPWSLFIGKDKVQFGVAMEERVGSFGPPREEALPLKGFPDGVVDGQYVRSLRAPFLWRYAPLAVLLYFLGFLLAVLIQAYLFTLVISFAESATLRKFGFNEFFNIAAHASAPAIIVVTALVVSRSLRLDGLFIAFLATYFVFVMGATAACRREEDEQRDRDELM